MQKNIEIIDQKKANEIVETYKPIGLFLLPANKNNVAFWTAIDNLSGEAFSEDFETKENAVLWLLKYS